MFSPVQEGQILAGKYRIDKVLGVGGMGVVVAAHHIQLDDRVAIKFMLPEALSNREAVARFAREARAAVKIKSEHVARVTDVGTLENGAPYMVMEYLEGRDLASWLKQRGALPIEQAIEFLLQALEAIAEAHALGIVHRDLKPANLFVVQRFDGGQSVKVLDFGISKAALVRGSSDLTDTSAVMGSPLYMSPEQMRSSKDADARSDMWSLGIILYELVTGNCPFVGDTMPEVVLKIMSAPPPPLRNMRPDAPAALEAVILKCLEKDRARRFRTVAELALALLEFAPKRARLSVERISGSLKGAGLSPSALALPPSEARNPTDSTGATWGHTKSGARGGGKAVLGVVLFGVVAAAAIGLGFVLHRSPAPPLDIVTKPAAAVLVPELSAAPVASSSAELNVTPSALPVNSQPSAAPAAPPAVKGHPNKKAAPNCNPDFYLDANGEKHFKPECFH